MLTQEWHNKLKTYYCKQLSITQKDFFVLRALIVERNESAHPEIPEKDDERKIQQVIDFDFLANFYKDEKMRELIGKIGKYEFKTY